MPYLPPPLPKNTPDGAGVWEVSLLDTPGLRNVQFLDLDVEMHKMDRKTSKEHLLIDFSSSGSLQTRKRGGRCLIEEVFTRFFWYYCLTFALSSIFVRWRGGSASRFGAWQESTTSTRGFGWHWGRPLCQKEGFGYVEVVRTSSVWQDPFNAPWI